MLLVALVVYLSSTSDVFFTSINLQNILDQGAILAMVAFGVTLVVLSGEFDLSVGATVALSGVIGAKLAGSTDSVLIGFLACVGVGAIVGLINGVLVAYVQIPSFIVTLGALTIARGLALAATDGGTVTGLPSGIDVFGDEQLLGLSLLVWLTAAVFLAIWFIQRQTSLGVRIYATGGNRDAARLAGVPVARVRLAVFAISGITAGVAGMGLLSRVGSGQPSGAQLLELFAVAAIVVGGTSLYGGRGSVVRTLFGVLLIVVLQNGLDIKGVDADIQQVIVGAVLIASASVDFVRIQLRRRRARTVTSALVAAPVSSPSRD
ncbi:ABC transporter permease [Conexibacter woesei]|uniref:ABC transporter permease n=1 Tax=Conexibacter woesei TaxID=191495 RepID=UPI000674762F|nr:ABC transporter permease [Conexibacter woesei]